MTISALRAHLKSLGISLRSATCRSTTRPRQVDGRVLASFAQFDNDVRSDRTRAGMRAALGRPMDLSCADQISERAEMVRQEPGSGPERAPPSRVRSRPRNGRHGKFLARINHAGLRTGRRLVLSPQSFGQMVRTSINVGLI
jgi:hypothetical protein